MNKIFVTYIPQQQKHFVVKAIGADGELHGKDGVPENLFRLGHQLVTRALAEGKLLEHRGDRFTYKTDEVIVDSVR